MSKGDRRFEHFVTSFSLGAILALTFCLALSTGASECEEDRGIYYPRIKFGRQDLVFRCKPNKYTDGGMICTDPVEAEVYNLVRGTLRP